VELQRRVNKLLAPTIVVRDAAVGPEGFDARRWATGRSYRYTVLNRPVPDPFLAHLSWHVDDELDLRSMQLACDPLIGEHDFTSFCRKPPSSSRPDGRPPSMVRIVRSLVATMVAVGRGRIRAGDMAWILRSQDRSKGAGLAPPEGLCLWAVEYGGRTGSIDSDGAAADR